MSRAGSSTQSPPQLLTGTAARQHHDALQIDEALRELVRALARQQARADYEAEQQVR